MYIIRNLTNKPIVLSDIRAEIGPHRIVDLETITSRDNIERSSDLKHALNIRGIQFVKQTVIRVPNANIETPQPKIIQRTIEKTIEKAEINEEKLRDIVRGVVQEQMNVKPIEETVTKAVSSGMAAMMNSIRDRLDSIQVVSGEPKVSGVDVKVDPSKLAEAQQKVVEKISKDIDSNRIKHGKKIKLVDSKISDLAKEL